ncbi:Protein PHLOEM PROTEIN 2-LIKE A10 [Rhynchospora pubera]|uniref:Protein PHLOEM PROTEIN 2-LIKE A10 n=1 Tax=Rhynchospora pubera TaxID=906938 RepID=A0AAV8DD46_9POAL|nr:Protein PHLOEM PROTEIN 2-LIKE A10 [Rhynchospora pubera]
MALVRRQLSPLEASIDLLPAGSINMAVDFSRHQGQWLVSVSKMSLDAAISFSRRHRRWFVFGGCVAVGYGAYKVLTLPAVARKAKRISKLLEALILLANAMSTSADSIVLISSDLNHFLLSDTDEVPKSLRQLSKISASKDFLNGLSKATEALTKGIIKGVTSTITSATTSSAVSVLTDPKSKPFLELLFEKVTTTAGAGFVSVVVGSFARNLVIAYYSVKGGQGIEGWVTAFCSDKGKELVAHCIQVFVSSAVKVYLNKSLASNTCDQIIASLTHPKNEGEVKDLIVSVCNGAVETLVKTSHKLIITSGSSIGNTSIKAEISQPGAPTASQQDGSNRTDSGSIMGVPSNRRLMLDVTGRVTAEMVKSFLDFLLKKISDGAKSGYGTVKDEVLEKGMEIMKYLSAKTMAIFALCIALCMQLSIGTRLLPAP